MKHLNQQILALAIPNILTNLAYHKREISVFGGSQLRPNIHIADMVEAYLGLLKGKGEKGVLVDVKGALREAVRNRVAFYWRL